jgi:transcriptional regulator with XRE-family HTH domain
MTIGNRLRTMRERQGVTLSEQARRMKRNRQQVNQWEMDDRNPRFRSLQEYANALQVRVSDIVKIGE